MNKTYLQKIGMKIKFLRMTKGLSQKQLAEECDMTRSYLSLIENGSVNPTLDKLKSISDFLNISLESLFCEDS